MSDVQKGSAHRKHFLLSQEIIVMGRKQQNGQKMANSSRRSFHGKLAAWWGEYWGAGRLCLFCWYRLRARSVDITEGRL